MSIARLFASPAVRDWRLSNGKSYLLALFAGAAITLSLAPFSLWPLGIISPAILLWLLIDTSPAQAFKRGWFYGLGLFGAGTSWVYVSIHVYGYTPAPLAALLTFIFCAGLGLFTAITFYIYARWVRDFPGGHHLGFAAIFVLGEWWRSWFLTGFPWLYLGYGHLASPLTSWAPIGSVYLISFIVVYTAAVITHGIDRQRWFKGHFVLCSMLWITGPILSTIEWSSPKDEPITVAMVQANISQHVKWDRDQLETTLRLYSESSAELWPDYDLVIWPEAAIPAYYQNAKSFLEEMGRAAQKHQSTLITGIPVYNHELAKAHNSIMAFGNGDGRYYKQRLVPFGEYIPLENILHDLIKIFNLPMSAFSSGNANQAPLTANHLTIAPFICYEIVYPELISKWLPEADLLLTISNDAWFGRSIGPLQHLEMAQMRALETGRYLIRSTGSGVSAIINHHGEIVKESAQFKREIVTGTAIPMTGSTPFTITGIWPIIILCSLLTLLPCVVGLRAARIRG